MDVSLTPRLSGPARTEKIATLAKDDHASQRHGGQLVYTAMRPYGATLKLLSATKPSPRRKPRVEAEHGVPTWQPQTPVDDNDVDWSAEPRDGLRLALRERDNAWHYAIVLQSLPTDRPHVARKLMLV